QVRSLGLQAHARSHRGYSGETRLRHALWVSLYVSSHESARRRFAAHRPNQCDLGSAAGLRCRDNRRAQRAVCDDRSRSMKHQPHVKRFLAKNLSYSTAPRGEDFFRNFLPAFLEESWIRRLEIFNSSKCVSPLSVLPRFESFN